MNKSLIIFFLIMFSYPDLYSQDEDNLKRKFYLASDFGFMLGTINRIEVSPALGYYCTNRFSIAGGTKYEFYSETRLYAKQVPVKTSIYGTRVFARYTIINNLGDFLPIGMNTSLFAHSELESSNLERKYFDYPNFPSKGRFWYSTILIGGGISQTTSERVHINILVLWNTDAGYVPLYHNPVIRFGFQFFLRPRGQ
jgi:hypothetical protein